MAKVKFSALISEMRNKLNGSVFSRNRGGSYLRNKVTPLNPKTMAQTKVRNRLIHFSQKWSTLTETQRKSWYSAGPEWSKTDIFGDNKIPSGNTLYTRLNFNIVSVGGTAIDEPPTPQGVEALQDLTISADGGASPKFDIGYDPTPLSSDSVLVISASPAISPGISNANSLMREIAHIDSSDSSPYDGLSDFNNKFGALESGKKVFITGKIINKTTGEEGLPLKAETIIA